MSHEFEFLIKTEKNFRSAFSESHFYVRRTTISAAVNSVSLASWQ